MHKFSFLHYKAKILQEIAIDLCNKCGEQKFIQNFSVEGDRQMFGWVRFSPHIYFPPSDNRLNLIYMHGKSVLMGFQARGIQMIFYCKT